METIETETGEFNKETHKGSGFTGRDLTSSQYTCCVFNACNFSQADVS
jgi:hypothetical protein